MANNQWQLKANETSKRKPHSGENKGQKKIQHGSNKLIEKRASANEEKPTKGMNGNDEAEISGEDLTLENESGGKRNARQRKYQKKMTKRRGGEAYSA